ncbi:hypothetical protein RRG08_005532 [Elysia crispata]|uniref:VWFA domain-containing protein n=1 Tax=Elysia crispata TaxID=231223 RepID=A0AAE0XR48_9GAST|nr:hypothetical protein RRG08_005532 [Elysia crispata]
MPGSPASKQIVTMLRLALILFGLFTVSDCAKNLTCSPKRQADIFLLLDASGSLGKRNFVRTLHFVEGIVDFFTIGPDSVRVGLATFAKYVGNRIWLDQYMNKTSLLEAVHAIRYSKGNTKTNMALKLARFEAFSEQHGGRDTVPNFLVVLTDGQSSHPKKTEREANLLAKENITVLAIGVGGRLNRKELKVIASSPSLVFSVKNFKALTSIKSHMVTNICEGSRDGEWSEWGGWSECSKTCGGGVQYRERNCLNPAPANGGKECEGLSRETLSCNQESCFLNASGSVGLDNFKHVLDFVKALVSSFPISPDRVRVGMETFAGRIANRITMDQHMDTSELVEAVNGIRYTRGPTNTHLALKQARLYDFAGGRDMVPNFLVVLTDGRSSNPLQTEAEASLLAKENITVLTIGVGGFKKKELELIASSPNLVLDVKSVEVLHRLQNDLVEIIC